MTQHIFPLIIAGIAIAVGGFTVYMLLAAAIDAIDRWIKRRFRGK